MAATLASASASPLYQGPTPRPYQASLAADIGAGNALVVLPTGLGKTVVAAIAVQAVLERRGRVLILAPTRPLARQHAATFARWFPTVLVTCQDGATQRTRRSDGWNARIIVATPTVAVNDHAVGGAMNGIQLLVLDEAHHAVGDAAAARALAFARELGTQVLGLTATPGSGDRYRELIGRMGQPTILQRTERSDDVRPHVHGISAEFFRVHVPPELRRAADLLRRQAARDTASLQRRGLIQRRATLATLIGARQRVHARGGRPDQAALARGIRCLTAARLVETHGAGPAASLLERAGHRAAEPGPIGEALQAMERAPDHPKLARAIQAVRTQLDDGCRRILVFTQFRATARDLARRFQAAGVPAALLLGHAGSSRGKHEQARALDAIGAGAARVLVATSVGEEGLDLPGMDAVVLFEPLSSPLRMVQRRGRTGRHGPGRLLVLVASGTADERAYRLWQLRQSPRPPPPPPLPPAFRSDEPAETAPDEAAREPGGVSASRAVLVDHRQMGSSAVQALRRLGVQVEPAALAAADLVLPGDLAVQRKTGAEFARSVLDGRHTSGAKAMRDAHAHCLVVVEGPLPPLEGRRRDAILTALAELGRTHAIPVLHTSGAEETAWVLAGIHRRAERDGRAEESAHQKGRSDEDLQRYLVEGLPMMSPALAQRLLQRFGSPHAAATAPGGAA